MASELLVLRAGHTRAFFGFRLPFGRIRDLWHQIVSLYV